MALGIPLPGAPGESFLKSLESGGNLFSRIMQPKIAREQMAQQKALQEQRLAQQMQMHNQSQARMNAMLPLQQKMAQMKLQQMEMELDPAKKFQYMQSLLGQMRNARNQQQEPSPEPMIPFTGMGMPSAEEIKNPTMPPPREKVMQGFGFEDMTPDERAMLQMSGIKIPNSPVLTGSARDAESMEMLRKRYGKDSEIVRDAEALNKQKIQQYQDLSAIRQRQTSGLKPGDTPILNPETGEIEGFNKQLTDKEREAAKNTTLFNNLYPLVYKGSAVFSGPGATNKLHQAAKTYNTNPASRKLIDDFLIAEKAATTTAVTEAARFGAGKTNQTFNRFLETLKAEDIHSKLKKWIKEYNIPASATMKAGIRWQNELNKAEHKANKNIPAARAYYYDPEKQFAHQEQQNTSAFENETENMEPVLMMKNGQMYNIPANEVTEAEKMGYQRG